MGARVITERIGTERPQYAEGREGRGATEAHRKYRKKVRDYRRSAARRPPAAIASVPLKAKRDAELLLLSVPDPLLPEPSFEPELELLEADGQPTPLYVARMIFAACSARPYVGAWS